MDCFILGQSRTWDGGMVDLFHHWAWQLVLPGAEVFGNEKLVCVAQSLACQWHLSFWETLSPSSCEAALYIPCALTFALVGRPCLTGELSQMVDYEQGGGGQVTDWHLQAFGEWLAYLFPREPERLWEHCVWQREWTQCGSLCSLLNVNVLLVLLLFFLLGVLRCVSYTVGSYSWDLVHVYWFQESGNQWPVGTGAAPW